MKKMYFTVVLLTSLVLGACSSNDGDSKNAPYTETTVTEAPVWQMDWSNNQERPNWTDPGLSSIYENWTILKVQLEDALKPYAADGDLMALFVNGELRALASPAINVGTGQTGNGKFLLKAYGNETGTETVNMTLQYYSQTLKHLFTLSGDITLNSDETTGIDEAYIPEFTYGSAKYPIVMQLNTTAIINQAKIQPAKGDYFAAFVGDECRGVSSSYDDPSMVVYGCQEGESITLKYYQAATGKVFTFPDAAKTKR